MAIDEALGDEHEITVRGARLRYRERGEGPPVVFVHGVLANADLWRAAVPALVTGGLRCISPDWPLGSHAVPVPEADLSPPGLATMIAEFLERLDLDDVTLVANDSGGALVQILLARPGAADRIGRVVLTPCDSFESFFPPRFAFMPLAARIPGALWPMTQLAGTRLGVSMPIGYSGLTRRGLPPSTVASFADPARRDPAIRADLVRVLRGVDKRHTLAAAQELHRFDRPVLLAWSIEDRVFPISLAHRLAERFPCARIVGVADAATFVPVDQPGRLAELLLEFVRAPAPRPT